MQIEILDDVRYSGKVKPGKYQLQPYDTPTAEQNKTFHALCQEFWRSGCHSYPAKNFLHFRELIKLYLCAGTERYYSLVDDNGKPLKEPVIRYRVKSWRDYTKRERTEAIDRLVSEMIQAGIDTEKFNEILQGMQELKG